MAQLDIEARRAALRGSPLFHNLEPAEIDALLAQAMVRWVSNGSIILQRGQPCAGVIIIVTGRVRIGTVSEDGRDVTLGILGPGDVVGEMSVLDGDDISADATAIDDCVLLSIERSRFLRLLHENGEICLRLLVVLARRIRAANALLEDMALLDLPARLGRLLLRLARDYGTDVPGGRRIQVKLSQKDIAAMIGASREKVNRQLRQWEHDGLLARELGYIVVLRTAALADAACGDVREMV